MSRLVAATALLGGLLADMACAGELVEGYPQMIDSTTIAINGRPIVLYGIKSGSGNQLCNSGRYKLPCDSLAASELARLIGGQLVICDIVEHDSYRRAVGQCFRGDLDLAAELVTMGLVEADPEARALGGPEFKLPDRSEPQPRQVVRDPPPKPAQPADAPRTFKPIF